MKRLFSTLSLILVAFSASAVELRQTEVRSGTEGLVNVPVSLANASDAPIVCIGELAHWYSAELARADSGATATIALWFDPQTGTYAVLNDKDENMPVEALWCGLAGRSYETRAAIPLDRKRDATPGPLALTCAMGAGRLSCE